MKVNINQVSYEYGSDYPAGWMSSSVDFFKFPVAIGNHLCFIKRFEKQSPSSISGWGLLVGLEKQPGQNLARIYDIKSVEEKNKRVYYVFYEYLEGKPLDKLISGNTPIDLTKLTIDLFRAMASLQKHGFWYADFFEKNIILEESGRAVLVDLDSAQPVSKPPADKMWGSRNYWGPVFDFYTKILNYKDLKVADLPGLSLNHLQIIFLILRLKILNLTQQDPKNYSDTLDNLHIRLDEIAPSCRELFIKVFDERNAPRHLDNATEIEDFINKKIINYGAPLAKKPIIKAFGASTNIIGRRESFELNWEVIGATYVELYQNGALYEKFNKGESGVKTSAFYDGGSKIISYKLIAYNGEAEVESDPVDMRFKERMRETIDAKIEKFAASPEAVKNGENFELSWQVIGAEYVELYKDGEFDEIFNRGETSVKKKAFYDNESINITYKLIAYKDNNPLESRTVDIRLKEHIPETTVLKIEKFAANPDTVKNGGNFELSWEVKGAGFVELYKNEAFDAKFTRGETTVSKNAFFDNGSNAISYKLIAYKDDMVIESSPIDIRLKDHIRKPIEITIEKLPAAPGNSKNVENYEQIPEVKAEIKPPVIDFSVKNYLKRNDDSFVVESGKPFTLVWSVNNAEEIQIQKDGRYFKTISSTEKSLVLTENVYEGAEIRINFTLSASFTDTGKIGSSTVKIIVRPSHPVIKKFKASRYILKSEESFTLYWDVQNAAAIALYKDGELYKTFNNGEKNIEIKEKYDGTKRKIKYSLQASGGFEKINSKPINIFIRPPVPVKIFFIAAAALVLLTVLYYVKPSAVHSSGIVFDRVTYDKIKAGDTIIISGKDFPENDNSIEIKFNGVKGEIVNLKTDAIQVKVPELTDRPKYVTILADSKNKTYQVAQNLLYPQPLILRPKLFNISNSVIAQNDIITIRGENLPTDESAIRIKFNNADARVIKRTKDSISVLVPTLKDGAVEIKARMDGGETLLSHNIIYQKKIGVPVIPIIYSITESPVIEDDIITINGANLPIRKGSIAVKFNNENGAIIEKNPGILKIKVPKVTKVSEEINNVTISVSVDGHIIKAFSNIGYRYKEIVPPPPPNVKVFPIQEDVIEGRYIQIPGENFPPKKGAIVVKFDNVQAYINQQNPGALRVLVPNIQGVNKVDIQIIIDGQPVKTLNNISYQLAPKR